MGTAQGIRAGRAFVELFADDSKLVRGLRRAEKKIKVFGKSIRTLGLKVARLGAVMLAPMLLAAKAFGSMGDQIAKMAKRTGFSVEALSELRFVASQTGTSMEALENGLRRMQRSIYDAGRGLSTAVDAFDDLGLTFRDFAGLKPAEQFKLIADRMSQIKDPTKKAAIAMLLLGRSGTAMLPMFAKGAAGIEELQKEARRLGLTMSSEDAKAAEVFTDAIDSLWKVVKMAAFHIGAALAPVLTQLAEKFTSVSMKISAWIKENKGLFVSALKTAAVIVAVGIALAVLGQISFGVGAVLGVLTTTVTILAAVGTAAFTALAATIAFLVTPFGLVIAAVVALGAVLLYVTGAGAKALDWLGAKFQVLKDDALASFGGIADALAAGDIALAAKIMWLMVKMEWTRGVNFLEKAWLNFRNFFIKTGYDAFHGMLAAVQIVWHAMEVGWIETSAFFAKTWRGFESFFSKSWERMKFGALKAWYWIESLFDDRIDMNVMNRLIDEQKDEAINRIDNEKQRKIAEREAERETKRKNAQLVHEGTMAGLGRENLDKHRQLDAEYGKEMAENEDAFAKARTEWQDAIAKARQKREEGATGPEQTEGPDWLRKFRESMAGMGNIGDRIGAEADRIGVRGTFNASALQGLAAGDSADRTALATEETARNTKRLVRAAQGGGLNFA